MFSLKFQEKIRKSLIGFSGFMHRLGLAGAWLRFVSATQRFIIWRSPFIKSLNISYVIDIGANSGEFALLARAAFPGAEIFSFEPQAEAFKTLNKVMKKDRHFQSFQVALGEKESTETMYVSPFSPSSSFIVQNENSQPVEFQMQTLDNYFYLIQKPGTVLMKLDVEGYELSVLKGAEEFIAGTDWIYIECRTSDMIGCSFSEIYNFLTQREWEFQGAYDSVFSKKGKLVYFDALFKNYKKRPVQLKIKQAETK